MTQHGPSKVIGGESYDCEVWEDPEHSPKWRWQVTATPLDKDGNVSGPPKVVARGAEANQKDAEQLAQQWINSRVNPKAL